MSDLDLIYIKDKEAYTVDNLTEVCQFFYERFNAARFEEVDAILEEINLSEASPAYLTAVCRFTYVAHRMNDIKGWEAFRDKVYAECISRPLEMLMLYDEGKYDTAEQAVGRLMHGLLPKDQK